MPDLKVFQAGDDSKTAKRFVRAPVRMSERTRAQDTGHFALDFCQIFLDFSLFISRIVFAEWHEWQRLCRLPGSRNFPISPW